MIDGRHFFDQLVKTDLKTYDNIQKITTGQSIVGLFHGNLQGCNKKVLKIHLHQTSVLLQNRLIVVNYRK